MSCSRSLYRVFIFLSMFSGVCWSADESIKSVIPDGYVARPSAVVRYALVIGVETYAHLPKVENATNDGIAAHNALLRAGFTYVRHLSEPQTTDAILDHIAELMQQAQADIQPAVVTIFFAGHGFQGPASNYIVPAAARADDLTRDSLPITTVLRKIALGTSSLAIVFLDACRTVRTLDKTNYTTPLTSSMRPGFGAMQESGTTVIGMAASLGYAAQSVGGAHPTNSPYTAALRLNMSLQSTSLDEMFDNMRSYVKQDTDELQVPTEMKRAGTSRFFLHPGPQEDAKQHRAWQKVVEGGARRKCLQDYIARYPAGIYSNSAEYLLKLHSGLPQRSEPVCSLD